MTAARHVSKVKGFGTLFTQTLPNVLFVFAVLGIILMILRRLPEAANVHDETPAEHLPVEEKLSQKGLPAIAVSGVRSFFLVISRRIWNFMLEAKDLRPASFTGYRIKKFFREKPKTGSPENLYSHPAILEHRDEQYFLDLIKREPKVLSHYDTLGKYYLEKDNVSDARDVYLYLVAHQPTSAEYYSKLAGCFFRLKEYQQAADNYRKSVALDSTQPNRYYNLGLSLEAVGKRSEALKSFEQASLLEPASEKYRQAQDRLKTKTRQTHKSI